LNIEIKFLKPDQVEFFINAVIGFIFIAILTQILGSYVDVIKSLGIAINIIILIVLVMIRSRIVKWRVEEEDKYTRRRTIKKRRK